ncbi:hypothetical protein H7R52_16450 [Weissella confusa]|uniref:2,3,4,5-tetrahydropyridine-2,6-dicarboxylate N-acetyltransferase N-terminal domain-containing protein n=1 Tax=Weissella confusa TaxID=1583 RepID=A0A923NHC6_WEICO|nr:hypothetical protein [Weissella confusa]
MGAVLGGRAIVGAHSHVGAETPARVTLAGDLTDIVWPETVQAFIETRTGTVIGDFNEIAPFLAAHADQITNQHVELLARNSGVPLLASNYNRNPRPAVVFVENGEAKVVVERESYQDIVRLDRHYL